VVKNLAALRMECSVGSGVQPSSRVALPWSSGDINSAIRMPTSANGRSRRTKRLARSLARTVTFADRYGPWAIVAGASDGVGAGIAEELARRGVDVVLLARRQAVLDSVAAGIRERTGARTRTLAVDFAEPGAAGAVIEATKDLEIGFVVYCPAPIPTSRPSLINRWPGRS
jgi:hypothetical protein